jgi:hypothetical protein
MDARTRATFDAITEGRAPRDLDWKRFEAFWRDVADEVVEEHGDRLSVTMNGHREVFHRPTDARVTLAEIEKARHLLGSVEATPVLELLIVAMDEERARLVEIAQPRSGDRVGLATVTNDDHRARRLRTVQRRTSEHDEVALDAYFDAVAEAIRAETADLPVVLLGHGTGASDAAELFVAHLGTHYPLLLPRIRARGVIDLSNASDAEIEDAARRAIGEEG